MSSDQLNHFLRMINSHLNQNLRYKMIENKTNRNKLKLAILRAFIQIRKMKEVLKLFQSIIKMNPKFRCL